VKNKRVIEAYLGSEHGAFAGDQHAAA